MAQLSALKSEAFLDAETRGRASLGEAFKDVDKIMGKFMPSITNASIGNHDFKDGLSDKYESQSAYGKALAKIKTARKTAEIGVPELSQSADKTLKRLYSLDGALLKRFGLQHEIFGDKKKEFTDEQAAHLPSLDGHKNQIKLAQSVVDKIDIARGITRTIKPERKR